MLKSIVLIAVFAVAATHAQFKCPKNRGQFEHPEQCDKYYVCDEGVATEKICPDGLVFDQTIRLANKCDQPFNVDCGDRLELQDQPRSKANSLQPTLGLHAIGAAIPALGIPTNSPDKIIRGRVLFTCNDCVPQETWVDLKTLCLRSRCDKEPQGTSDYCPRKNGFFSHPDPAICNVFYSCINGEELEMSCTGNLHFDEKSGTCVWPDVAARVGCATNAYKKLSDGFECPKEVRHDKNGLTILHPNYPHPTDCSRFYYCLNGIEPRQGQCDAGLVYNEDIQRCDNPDNVPECKDWYKDEDDKKSN